MEEIKVPIYYSNSTHLINSDKDFLIVFELLIPKLDFSKNTVEQNKVEQVKIYMSPVQFKAFLAASNVQLQGYEKKFGKIINTKIKTIKEKIATKK